MRDPARINPTIEALRAAWLCNPDLRLGQLLINRLGDDLYYAEDDLIRERLQDLPLFILR